MNIFSKLPVDWLLALLLVLSTLAAYSPAFNAGHIVDDREYYIDDPVMVDAKGLFTIWFRPLENNKVWPYIPITRTSFWIERQLWGLDLRISHALNILIHLASAFLLWKGLRFFRFPGAWWVGILFALHPMHVESVAWIAERKNVLVVFFYLLAMGCGLRFFKTREWRWYGLALLLFLFALLSKASAVVLPAVMIFALLWIRVPWRKMDFFLFLPFFGIGLAFAILRMWFAARFFVAASTEFSLSFVERVLIAGHVPFFYLSKYFFPHPLLISYPKWDIDPSQWTQYLPLASLFGVAFCCLWKFQSWGRPLFVGLGAFFVALIPVSGLFQAAWFQFSYVTDHWSYLPGIAVLILAVGLTKRLIKLLPLLFKNFKITSMQYGRNYSGSKRLMVLLGSLPILACGGLTWLHSQAYKDETSLWNATLKYNPTAWWPNYNLGTAALENKDFETAIRYLSVGLKDRSTHAKALNNRGTAYLELGQYQKAIDDYSQAVLLQPSYLDPYENRGLLFARLKNYERAIQDYTKVIQIDPENPKAYRNRGIVYGEQGRFDQAMQDFSRALRIKPNDSLIYNNRGNIYFLQGKDKAAIADYNQALKLDPFYASALNNRGLVYAQTGKNQQACQDWQQACHLGACEYYTQFKRSGQCSQ